MKARLYFEAHITAEAITHPEGFAFFKEALGDSWKVSRFDEDEVDGYDGKWFASARGVVLHPVETLVAAGVHSLQEAGFTVLRAKIEDTLLDTKHGDTIGGLKL